MDNSIEIRDSAINVDELMTRIRSSIEAKKKSQIYIEEPWMMQDVTQPELRLNSMKTADALAMLKIAGRLDMEGEKITSHRRFGGSFIKFMKRTTRFWVRRYTDAIFFKQNHFNMEIVDVLSRMNNQMLELKNENESLKEELKKANSDPSKLRISVDSQEERE